MDPAQDLTDENIGLILSWLTLSSLPSCAATARRWHEASVLGFSKQLLWRRQAHYCEVALPAEVGEGFVTFLGDGSSLILAAADKRIVTLWLPDGATHGQAEAQEKTSRQWPYSRLRSGVAGLVGYAGREIAFFPAAAEQGSTWSKKMQVIGRTYQNILHCGEHLFLLCRGNWWHDERLFADVLDMEAGTYQKIDITKLRDVLAELLGDDSSGRQAVSSTRDHFLFHVNTLTGTKIAGAVRLPKATGDAPGASFKAAPCEAPLEAPVSFAKMWPSSHPIAQLEQPNELPVEDHLLLYHHWERNGLSICLLDAATGNVRSQLLRPPLATGLAGQFMADRDLGALAVSLKFDVVCGCGVAPRGLHPPPVVVWDLSTGLVLHEFYHDALQPRVPVVLPEAPVETASSSGFRFNVGDTVECFTGDGWQKGQVTQWDYREADWPMGVRAPYQVRLTGQARQLMIYVPQDLPELIRSAANCEAYEPGEVDIQIVLHPARRCIMIGLWQKFSGRVHCIEVAP